MAPPPTPRPGHPCPTRTRPLAIQHCFRTLRDPRRSHRRRHLLLDIVVIALCAVICQCTDWQQIATWAQRHRGWLEGFLYLPNGIPSHDTFERVFDRLDPQAFQACFRQWILGICDILHIPHVAIDGKTLRHSGSEKLGPLHVVSAWATVNHLVLAEVAVAEKSNEITAIPQLLELLAIEGALVTIDAMGCQKEIARTIRERQADYVLTVKENQPHLLEDIQDKILEAYEDPQLSQKLDEWEMEERGHGRIERRSYTVLTDPEGLRNQEAWPDLCVIGMCTSERTVGGKMSVEVSYFIGSRRASARVYGKALRGHWGVENNLHWHLDVHFGEDANRVQKRIGAENLAVVRRMALALLKRHPAKLSIACKQTAAAADMEFLKEILAPQPNLENR